ncbi:hypothetical protein DM860_015002 [Cuscuta australis]|uniref:Uncharacterized protein n=1 Tax=Cuscuta australis TaxID=267555 RepID=A0A328DIU8_9ASTE|nr:hypothetical protein DM860_015002 [Cuscuta australis]
MERIRRLHGGSSDSKQQWMKRLDTETFPNSKQERIRKIDEGNHRLLNFNTMVELLQFDGTDVQLWIRKCAKYVDAV